MRRSVRHELPAYVIAAYAVFVVVLLWDLIAGRWQVRRALKTARRAGCVSASARCPAMPS